MYEDGWVMCARSVLAVLLLAPSPNEHGFDAVQGVYIASIWLAVLLVRTQVLQDADYSTGISNSGIQCTIFSWETNTWKKILDWNMRKTIKAYIAPTTCLEFELTKATIASRSMEGTWDVSILKGHAPVSPLMPDHAGMHLLSQDPYCFH